MIRFNKSGDSSIHKPAELGVGDGAISGGAAAVVLLLVGTGVKVRRRKVRLESVQQSHFGS